MFVSLHLPPDLPFELLPFLLGVLLLSVFDGKGRFRALYPFSACERSLPLGWRCFGIITCGTNGFACSFVIALYGLRLGSSEGVETVEAEDEVVVIDDDDDDDDGFGVPVVEIAAAAAAAVDDAGGLSNVVAV